MVSSSLIIHFGDQFFKIVLLWPIPNLSFWYHFEMDRYYLALLEKRSKPIGRETLRWENSLLGKLKNF